ncbi:MAG: methyltransferase [Acidobacteria bacterium]|nr:MAG: methyltransferase [Acidobacteriota bacterium]
MTSSKRRRANGGARADQSFKARVLSTVRRIPPGRVATYGDVAELAGRPRAARAVGNIMRDCRRRDVPCHRVIAAGGRIGGYGGSEMLKRSLLAAEGIIVSGLRIRDLDRTLWRPRR